MMLSYRQQQVFEFELLDKLRMKKKIGRIWEIYLNELHNVKKTVSRLSIMTKIAKRSININR